MQGSALPTICRRLATRPAPSETKGSTLPSIPGGVATLPRPLEIPGNALPSNSMPVETTLDKVTFATNVIRGVRKVFAARSFVWVDGKKLSPDDIIARFEEQLAVLEALRKASIAYDVALEAERRLRKPMHELLMGVRRSVLGELGPNAFPFFGWNKPRLPGPKTTASKLAGVQKRAAKKRSG
jgi:hypothetical protein